MSTYDLRNKIEEFEDATVQMKGTNTQRYVTLGDLITFRRELTKLFNEVRKAIDDIPIGG